MNFSVSRRTVSRRENGVELVRAVFSTPVGVCPTVDGAVAQATSWLDAVLVPYAKRVFDDDLAPEKRFSFRRFEYTLAVSLERQSEDTAELCIRAALSRARSTPFAETCRRETVRLSDFSFLPPRKTKKRPKRGASASLNQENR